MRQVADRLSVRWYVGYDLDEPLPDHSTLSKIRQRYGLEVFRRVFEALVEECRLAEAGFGQETDFRCYPGNAGADIGLPAPRVACVARERRHRRTGGLFSLRH